MGLWRRIKLWFTGSYHIEEYQKYFIMTNYDGIAYTLEIYDDRKKQVLEIHYYSFSELVADLPQWKDFIETYKSVKEDK